jgi:hypothetical protein
MVEVSTDRAVARRTIFCRNVRQNTARIDRTAINLPICSTFMRVVLYPAIARRQKVIDLLTNTARLSTTWKSAV